MMFRFGIRRGIESLEVERGLFVDGIVPYSWMKKKIGIC